MIFTDEGLAAFHSLPPAPRRAARRLMRDLLDDPFCAGTLQLHNQPEGRRRAAFGGRRIIYVVNQRARTIVIERVAPRHIVYRNGLEWSPYDPSRE